MATYLANSWSSVYGLATVAYGDPSRYPEVANQVIDKSPLKRFVGDMTPQAIIQSALTREVVLEALQQEYAESPAFRRTIDTGSKTLEEVAEQAYEQVTGGFDEISSYETSLSDILEYVGLPRSLAEKLNSLVPDLQVYSKLAANVPTRKLDKLPAGARIELSDSVDLASDSKGIGFSVGYLTPQQYFSGVAFPGAGPTADNLPNSILDSIAQGYRGYATLQPLDSLLRQGLSALITPSDVQDIRNVSRSVAGLGTISDVRDLTSIGRMSDADLAMYKVDLADLVVGLNGYTVYDPETDSNGDFSARVPEADNSDPGDGLPSSQRSRQLLF